MTTYFVTDERMLKHKCEWDNNHIERPERLKWILDKLRKTDLLDKCKVLESRLATVEELNSVHTSEYIEKIQQASDLSVEEQEKLCSTFEDIYLNSHTWNASLLSAGSAIDLTKTVLESKDPNANGFAAIRPPGHHASSDQACGFCIFNNIAICAKKAIEFGSKRVLIVDFDVHAGQGTQYAIKDDPNIRLISIHRFEEGRFWPLLKESSVVHEYPNTLNVPLNEIGMGDSDYISIMSTSILPLIHSWKPELILVSCGFDAAIGDPEGEMQVSPLGFGTLVGLLAIQQIPLVLLLEGGYFLESIGESTESVLRALIERTPPKMFVDKIGPSPSLIDSIVRYLHTYQAVFDFDLAECINLVRKRKKLAAISKVDKNEYKGERNLVFPYTTRGLYAPRETDVEDDFAKKLNEMIFQRKETEKKEIDLHFKKKFLELSIDETLYKLHAENFADLLFVYHFVFIPLSIKYKFAMFNFTQFLSHFSIPYKSNELISEKLIGDLILLPEDFGFWS
ncbi:Histone deacetylase family protein [Aphelenchoides bicaudatus]|nr:Histone deacetylase family protein [Aphelenchoides bicaudatus]